jgi:DNA-binding transcriptional regulator YiaG
MTGPEAVAVVNKLGLSQARFARLARLHPNAITKWKHGSQPHGTAVTLLLMLRKWPELLGFLEKIEGEKA